jgi:hypothetical protein
VEAHHEGLHDEHLARDRPQPLGLAAVSATGFAQDMLTRLGCLDGEARADDGQRVVNRLDGGIGKQLL